MIKGGDVMGSSPSKTQNPQPSVTRAGNTQRHNGKELVNICAHLKNGNKYRKILLILEPKESVPHFLNLSPQYAVSNTGSKVCPETYYDTFTLLHCPYHL